ncbi:MAG: chorismate-binding protein, partial [Vicinamibacterales bacterium]
YQVNYTFQMAGSFEGSAVSLFSDLVGAQRPGAAAFIDLGRYALCSASPEIYFERRGRTLSARPMKGTTRRGRTTAEDLVQRDTLRSSPKQQAENVMIVDMMRNDLGRIADVGSVDVPSLFDAERYPNVWQMTSVVTAQSSAALAEIFQALHPSCSVTGAPKVRTMAILQELEHQPRGIYTGAIGHVAPGGDARFNVAIRTAVVDRVAGQVRFGVGSGLVWDSNAGDEYDECLLKGSILGGPVPDFELLETLRWSPQEGFWLLDRHLDRLQDSAEYFGTSVDTSAVRAALTAAVAEATISLRVRLLVNGDGGIRVEQSPFTPSREPVVLRLARTPVDAADVFLFHKTTRRQQYDGRRLAGCDDVVLWNEEEQITETTIANVLAEVDGEVVTPPVECGLLAGTCRADLLQRGEVREQRLSIADLRRANRLWVTNAVQGRRSAVLLDD